MPRELLIDGCRISDDSDCYVIAEIGHNHQGSLEKAKEMFRVAKECGVNAVKLQKRDNRSLYTREMYDQPYVNENSFGATYGLHREALEFGREEYAELQRYARELGVTFFATAFDFASADFLADLEMPAYKIASGDLPNTPLLEYVAKFGKPMIISTGGGTLDDIKRAYESIAAHNTQVCILQCTASYPVQPEDMNLRVIASFREIFPDVTVGLSDHQNGIALSLVAQALGARVLEKHFTLDRAAKGTDHAFSLEPLGMKKLVRDLRRGQLALGSRDKHPLPCEEKPLKKMGKKIVAATDLPADHVLRPDDVALKSPGGEGLPPYEMKKVVGMKLKRALAADENVTFADLEGA